MMTITLLQKDFYSNDGARIVKSLLFVKKNVKQIVKKTSL